MKKLLKALCPPVLFRMLHDIYDMLGKSKREPKEAIVKSGPLAGASLLINESAPLFKEMHEGDYDSFFWDFLENTEFEGKTVLDVGGHIGYHALTFARKVGEKGQVYSFEPNPVNGMRFQSNLELNPLLAERVSVVKSAVSDRDGELKFRFSRDIEDGTSSGGYISGSERIFKSDIYSTLRIQAIRSRIIWFVLIDLS